MLCFAEIEGPTGAKFLMREHIDPSIAISLANGRAKLDRDGGEELVSAAIAKAYTHRWITINFPVYLGIKPVVKSAAPPTSPPLPASVDADVVLAAPSSSSSSAPRRPEVHAVIAYEGMTGAPMCIDQPSLQGGLDATAVGASDDEAPAPGGARRGPAPRGAGVAGNAAGRLGGGVVGVGGGGNGVGAVAAAAAAAAAVVAAGRHDLTENRDHAKQRSWVIELTVICVIISILWELYAR